MDAVPEKNFLIYSLGAHIALLIFVVISMRFAEPMPVVVNSNQQNVISAVVLGDTEKSKILPQKIAEPEPIPEPKPVVEPKPLPKPEVKITQPKPVPKAEPEVKKEVIALQKPEKKKIVKKTIDKKKQLDLLANDLLADLKKHSEKQKKVKQKQLQSQFEKMLREQAEKSLRQQLLNEEIKLRGTQAKLSQGIVNKYKALILQAISEQWVIPLQANRQLSSELLIRLAPGGMVLDVQVTKSSGDPSLDKSARLAVLKASPLPVPKDLQEFEAFRKFVLKVKPENILN